jgi:TRAP-type C4-dicarboxylate transport system permease small subunit
MTARPSVLDHVQRVLGWLLALLMGVMVADVTWQVVSRFVLRAPSSFTEELAGFLGIDLLMARLRGPSRRAATIFAHTLVAAFALSTMVLGGLQLVRLAFHLNQISAAMGIRVGFVYLALPLAGTLMTAFAIESIAKTAIAPDEA